MRFSAPDELHIELAQKINLDSMESETLTESLKDRHPETIVRIIVPSIRIRKLAL